MSQIALSPNALGTGTLTIASPNSNTDRTLTLPDATTTIVGTDTTQTLTNKSIVATQLTGTIAAARLPAGTVLQVVSATTSTQMTTTSATYSDTNLTASITPSATTSKILVLVNQQIEAFRSGAYAAAGINLVRGSTTILASTADSTGPYEVYANANGSTQTDIFYRWAISYLDSPSTTSSTIYKTQGAAINTTTLTCQRSGPTINGTSTITLIEIAG